MPNVVFVKFVEQTSAQVRRKIAVYRHVDDTWAARDKYQDEENIRRRKVYENKRRALCQSA